jgi:hypothetical protein
MLTQFLRKGRVASRAARSLRFRRLAYAQRGRSDQPRRFPRHRLRLRNRLNSTLSRSERPDGGRALLSVGDKHLPPCRQRPPLRGKRA